MNEHQRERYARQTLFAPFGVTGQERLLAARVVIIGCGANGSMMANTLARAGVGTLIVVDRDVVELKNLQRQILFDEDDAARGVPKAIAAAEKLRRANSSIHIEGIVTDVNAENIEDLIAGATLVMDGSDNFGTRFIINDACVKHSIPWIYAGVVASYGMTMTIVPRETACLRCVFAHPPAPGTLPTCDTAGILPPIVNVVASIASAEAIKLIAGAGTRNAGIIHVDVWDNTFQAFTVARRADCPTCVHNHFEYLEGARGNTLTAFLCGRNAIQINPGRGHTLNLHVLAERWREVGKVSLNEYLLRLEIGDYEITVFPDARAIIKGTDDASVARGLYAKYVGT
jgi:adenylyltransferase/sulfurtransferase